MEYMKQFLLD